MMMMTSTTDPNLEMLDIVHKLASLRYRRLCFISLTFFILNDSKINYAAKSRQSLHPHPPLLQVLTPLVYSKESFQTTKL